MAGKEIIDLSQEIYDGMPVYKSLSPVSMRVYATHEQWDGDENPTTQTPSVHQITMSEHTGTHVDALNHMDRKNAGESIDTMPLSMFFTEGICLDFSHKGLQELITTEDIKEACLKADISIKKETLCFFAQITTESTLILQTGPKAPESPPKQPNI